MSLSPANAPFAREEAPVPRGVAAKQSSASVLPGFYSTRVLGLFKQPRCGGGRQAVRIRLSVKRVGSSSAR